MNNLVYALKLEDVLYPFHQILPKALADILKRNLPTFYESPLVHYLNCNHSWQSVIILKF